MEFGYGHKYAGRAKYLKSIAIVGAKVIHSFPNEPDVEGTITRTSDSSIWVSFLRAKGNTTTFRFTLRTDDGEFRMSGQGRYAHALRFSK